MSDWAEVADDLRRALVRAGASEAARTLADLAPIFRAVEGARVARVEPELAWALLAVAADRARRRAQHERGRVAAG